jgi:hypothetical protein
MNVVITVAMALLLKHFGPYECVVIIVAMALLLKHFGPYECVVIIVAMALLLKHFRPCDIIFMTALTALDCPIILDGQLPSSPKQEKQQLAEEQQAYRNLIWSKQETMTKLSFPHK